MIEVWTHSEPGNDKLIGFGNNIIYKANPRTEQETEILAKGLKAGSYDSTKIWDISTKNCREIRLQDGKPYIEIFWGKEGEEQLRVADEYLRYKIFDRIRAGTPNAVYTVEKWNAFRAGKKPLIAMVVILALFAWTMFYAVEAQSGTVYYIENGRYDSLTGIVLGIASLGLIKVVTIFSCLLGIALFAFIRKAKKPPTMHRIVIRN
ncbi:MAG: hypothetical protein ACHQFX_05225 [Chitinophagales bacterium]